ncbi:hypothetical protein KCV07_g2750, partial [Aureobasidium melanogenum]
MSQIFRFMDLPRELRNRIYSYALSLDFYDKAHEKGFTCGYTHNTKQCNVLLMNRQTSDEAQKMIRSTPITLSYGLELEMSFDLLLTPHMGPESIRNYFPEARLCNVSQLTISDVGYRGKKRILLKEKHFVGLSRLLREVAEICREGHKLQHVLVSFQSDLVKEYIDQLTTSEVAQKWMFEVISSLREIRGVGRGRVTLDIDINHSSTTKQQLVADMESPHTGLLSLPKHVRQKIYGYALDFNDATKQMRDYALSSPTLTTPTMLLVNRQISAEVASFIREVPLEISTDPSVDIVFLSEFISLETVGHIKHVRLNVQRAEQLGWLASELVEAWTCGNDELTADSRLESFELNYHEPGLRITLLDKNERYPPKDVADAMTRFGKMRSIPEVRITGTLPRCFAGAIESNMMQSPACETLHSPRFLENGIKTSSDYDEYESDSEYDPEEDYGAPKTLEEYHDRMHQGENMPGYFYTESMAAERRQEEYRTRLEWELSSAQLGLILFPEDDDESSEDDDESSEDDEESSEDDEESSEDDEESSEYDEE